MFRPVIISTRKTVNQNGSTGDTGQARANGETAATRRRESWLPGWYVILMAVTAAVMILLLFQAASARSAAVGSVTREKLPASACVSSDQWLDDELDWITDQKTVTDAMQYFYDRTGVQPYLLIDDELAGKGESLTDAEAEDALVNLYDSLYRDDGHMIFAFIEYAPSEYLAYVYTGLAADSVVDANARGVFLGNVDRYYSDSSLTDEEFFAAVFRKTADTIMEDASGEASAATAYAVLCAALFIVMVGGLFLFKRREQRLREKDQLKEILSAPISSPEEQELEKKYGDGAPPTV